MNDLIEEYKLILREAYEDYLSDYFWDGVRYGIDEVVEDTTAYITGNETGRPPQYDKHMPERMIWNEDFLSYMRYDMGVENFYDVIARGKETVEVYIRYFITDNYLYNEIYDYIDEKMPCQV